jgi:hydrophobe/amphiphile efflux-1 (HAE1) family protein
VVFLFLGSVRATLIPIVAVPVALIGTFAVMQMMGFSLNTVSLLALVLAIGIVVDDAIVVVEAVEHTLEKEPHLTPAEATEKAMAEVTGPIIAITLVLLSVFIPTAFMPGIAGKLYQQFALTISVAMVISAINALSLSPALCALLLVRRGAPRGLMARVQRGLDATRNGYLRLAAPLIRRGVLAVGLVALFGLATGGLLKVVPTGFLPEEDQSSFMAEIQLPDAASTSRTLEAVTEVEAMLTGQPWLQNFFTVSGTSLLDGLNLPNRAMMIVSLKPYAERPGHEMSAFAVLERLNRAFQRVAAANVYAFNPPPIAGLGNSAGFEFEVQSLTGAPPEEIVAVARGVINAAQSAPELAGVFTTYSASTPQIRLELDRDRAETLGVAIPDIFAALQTAMGSKNVNNFNMFGRTWTVRVQADAIDRRTVEDVKRVRVRSANGTLVPLQAMATLELTTAPATINRYNNLRSVTLNGAPAAGYSSGEAIAAMERVARASLPPGYGFQWAGTAQQEKEAGSQTGFVLALAVLFAYLFLVGLYESLALPVAALLSVIVGLFGALAALWLTGLANNIYAQIGIVVLIALAAKNAILVIEVAMHERAGGSDPVTAATSAAGQRFRAVMMTSFAFILGLVPLVIASGAGAATQRAVGTAVFGGMLAASCLGIFVIPGLYVAFEKMRRAVPGLLRKPFRRAGG